MNAKQTWTVNEVEVTRGLAQRAIRFDGNTGWLLGLVSFRGRGWATWSGKDSWGQPVTVECSSAKPTR